MPDLGADRDDLVLRAIELARDADERCGSPGDADRLCRALWVAGVTDPVVVLLAGVGAADRDRSADLHWWALNEGLAVTEGELAAAFGFLVGSLDEFATLAGSDTGEPADEAGLARWVIERGAPRVAEPLAAAERACLLGADDQPGVVAESDNQEPGS